VLSLPPSLRQKHFAFLELNSVPITTSVIIQLDGIPFRGNPLKVPPSLPPSLPPLRATYIFPPSRPPFLPPSLPQVKRPSDYRPEILPFDMPSPPTLNVANFRGR